jgi:hypothetical protein
MFWHAESVAPTTSNPSSLPIVMSPPSRPVYSPASRAGPRGLAFYLQRVALEGSRPVIQKLIG